MTDVNFELAKIQFVEGLQFFESKDFEKATASFRKSLELVPGRISTITNLSASLLKLGRHIEVVELANRHLSDEGAQAPMAELYLNRGCALHELMHFDEATASLRQAIAARGQYAEAYTNLGNSLRELQRYKEAEDCYRIALQINPNLAEAHNNFGVLLQVQARTLEALASYQNAIAIDPTYSATYTNYAGVCAELGRLKEAEEFFLKAIEINPLSLYARSNFLFNLNYMRHSTPEMMLEQARHFGRMVSGSVQAKFKAHKPLIAGGKLRIGFVSGDLRNHPVGYFTEALFQHIDLNEFELFAFPSNSKEDDLTLRIKPFFREWIAIFGQTDAAAAQLIYEQGIHVLIDLSGHTTHNRLPVFAHKPAPVQVSWLGYFNTTGLPEMDYFLGDPYMAPDNEAAYFSEKIFNLKHTWLCRKPPANAVAIAPLPALQNGYLTFGCMGNISKMDDVVISLWSRILRETPNSKLLLKAKQLDDIRFRKLLQSKFLEHGVNLDQLIMEGVSSPRVYLATYNRIDIVLDTFPYPGGTTSVDALWMGVPVLTMKGNRFLSRLGESIAHNAGLIDWIANDHIEYINKALCFSQDIPHLAELRTELRERVSKSPLMDTQLFAGDFSDAMKALYARHISA
jgi:protein O-GlcNAc transferase